MILNELGFKENDKINNIIKFLLNNKSENVRNVLLKKDNIKLIKTREIFELHCIYENLY